MCRGNIIKLPQSQLDQHANNSSRAGVQILQIHDLPDDDVLGRNLMLEGYQNNYDLDGDGLNRGEDDGQRHQEEMKEEEGGPLEDDSQYQQQ